MRADTRTFSVGGDERIQDGKDDETDGLHEAFDSHMNKHAVGRLAT